MSDLKIPEEILLEVRAFESFVRRDLKRVYAYEAEEAGQVRVAAAMRWKAEEENLAGERMLERMWTPVEWRCRYGRQPEGGTTNEDRGGKEGGGL